MGKITVKNLTTLTDFSALMRAGLYLAGRTGEAQENGFVIEDYESRYGIVVKITEEQKKTSRRRIGCR